MISEKSEAVACWLEKNRVIEKEETALYQYAVESLCLSMSTIFLALIVGWILGDVLQSLVIITPFMFLRKFSGGYHAKYLVVCLPTSALLMFLSLFLSMNLSCNWILAAVTGCFALALMRFSPIDNSARRLEEEERKDYKRIVIILTLSFLFLAGITYAVGWKDFTKSICVGIQLAAALQFPCVLKKLTTSKGSQRAAK